MADLSLLNWIEEIFECQGSATDVLAFLQAIDSMHEVGLQILKLAEGCVGAVGGLGVGIGAAGCDDDGDIVARKDVMAWAAICSITAAVAGMSSSVLKTASKADFQSSK